MASSSNERTSAPRSGSAGTLPERRRSPRRKPPQLVYVEFGRENGGMLKDVSDGGLRFHLMNPVAVGQKLPFAVGIDAFRRFEGLAEMVWTDASGKSGGLAFAELSDSARQTLQDWLAEMDGPQRTAEQAPSETTAAPLTAAVLPPATPIAARWTTSAPFPGAPAAAVPAAAHPATQVPKIPSPIPSSFPNSQMNLEPSPPASAAPPPTDPAMLEIGSQFIAAPVSREVWQRAAREEIAPGERSRRPLAAAKAKAMHDEVRAASHISSPMVEANSPASVSDRQSTELHHDGPREAPRGQEKPFQEILSAEDPFRDFLKRPIGAPAEARASLGVEDFIEDLAHPPVPVRARRSTSRLLLVFAITAICVASAAFAAITYRQSIGEAIIWLGETIRGTPQPAHGPETEVAPAIDSPVADKEATSASHSTERRSGANTSQDQLVPDSTPANTPPAATRRTLRNEEAAASNSLRESGTGQTQLASGRQIIPGKPRRPTEDVASLWIAVENGDTSAEILLAEHYLKGEGVEKNCEQARVLLQAAAKHGSTAAAQRLAQLAATGCQ